MCVLGWHGSPRSLVCLWLVGDVIAASHPHYPVCFVKKDTHTHTHASVCFIFISLRVCLFVCFLTGAAVGDPLCFLFVPHPFIIFYY